METREIKWSWSDPNHEGPCLCAVCESTPIALSIENNKRSRLVCCGCGVGTEYFHDYQYVIELWNNLQIKIMKSLDVDDLESKIDQLVKENLIFKEDLKQAINIAFKWKSLVEKLTKEKNELMNEISRLRR